MPRPSSSSSPDPGPSAAPVSPVRPAEPALVLASTSPYRRRQLERLRIPFVALAPDFDERAAEAALGPASGAAATPADLARALARGKARAGQAAAPHAHVLGGDQLAALGSEVLGKPGTVEAAEAQLARLAGRTHDLWTAVALAHPDGHLEEHLDHTRLTVRALEAEEIARYVRLDTPLDCAGSYKLESLGIALFERIESEDASAVEGLPLLALARLLRGAGFRTP